MLLLNTDSQAKCGPWGVPRAVLLVAVAVAASIVGCMGQASKQYQTGKDLLAQGEYDEAVESLRQAAAQEPHNGDILRSLGDAESLAADRHVDRAEKLLVQGKLTDAQIELQRALELMPAHPRGNLMLRKVERQRHRDRARPVVANRPASPEKPSVASTEKRSTAPPQVADRTRRVRKAQAAGSLRSPTEKRPKAQTPALTMASEPSAAATSGSQQPKLPARSLSREQPTQERTPAAKPAPKVKQTRPPKRALKPTPIPTMEQIVEEEKQIAVANKTPTKKSISTPPPARPRKALRPVVDAKRAPTAAVAKKRSTSRVLVTTQPADAPPSKTEPIRASQAIPATTYRGTISRDDDRYPKSVRTLDGIVVKVKDADSKPLDADLEIRVGGIKIKKKDLPVGAGVTIRLNSGRTYRLVVLAIDGKEETVHFSLEQVDSIPGVPG